MVVGWSREEGMGGKRMWCPDGQKCEVEWAYEYLGDCICSPRDTLSFTLGLLSVISWAVAEVPQIVSNFRLKSTEGVSLAFLITWVVGDIFNLAGCYLQPATLPTQFYMALLYTITTIVLVLQTIYYGHLSKRRKEQLMIKKDQGVMEEKNDDSKTTRLLDASCNNITADGSVMRFPSTQPISTLHSPSHLYYMSARSLASSHTPTAGSYLSVSKGSGRKGTLSLLHQSSFDEPPELPGDNRKSLYSPPNSTNLLRVVASIALCIGGLNIPTRASRGFIMFGSNLESTKFQVFGRKLLQRKLYTVKSESGIGGEIGILLGWLMAAIYMGGRLPQIWLNVKRGTIEGLNPLMFMFALTGNVTYVGSILVRSTDWERIKLNLPWIVDAGVCVVLDLFIILQFIYYFGSNGKNSKQGAEKH